jgi:hypothetical protein
MSNQLIDPNQLQDSPEPEKAPTYSMSAVVRDALSILKAALIVAPVVFVLVIVALALLGPSVGNVFSNIVSSL